MVGETFLDRSTSGEVNRLSSCADGFDPHTVCHENFGWLPEREGVRL